MSSEDTIVGNGPMTIRRSLNNILAALNIAQGKGAFNLRESAFIFTSLQKMNEFVQKYENKEPNEEPKQTPVSNQVEKVVTKNKDTVKQSLVQKREKLPEINLDENVTETIEI